MLAVVPAVRALIKVERRALAPPAPRSPDHVVKLLIMVRSVSLEVRVSRCKKVDRYLAYSLYPENNQNKILDRPFLRLGCVGERQVYGI